MFDDPDSLNRVMSTYRLPIGDDCTYTINIKKKDNSRSRTFSTSTTMADASIRSSSSMTTTATSTCKRQKTVSLPIPCIPPYNMPKYIKDLLPQPIHNCRWLLHDRMYAPSYLSHQHFSSRMSRQYGKDGKRFDQKSVESFWYQYVFMDNEAPTCTFFGITRYSFVSLIGYDYIGMLRNTKTMYYSIASLTLAQTVMSLYYSREISEISKELDQDKLSKKELRRSVNILNRDYLRFVNNVYFREVTPQDQRIDLYELMQQQISIKRDEEGLRTEVEQLYHYVTMTNDEQRNTETEKLSIIATIFLVPTLVTGIWGMNLDEKSNLWYWILSGATIAVALIVICQLIRVRRK